MVVGTVFFVLAGDEQPKCSELMHARGKDPKVPKQQQQQQNQWQNPVEIPVLHESFFASWVARLYRS